MIIIAEIGINHNGSLPLAHELIRQAKLAGADIAKFQFYDPFRVFGPQGSHPDPRALEQAVPLAFRFEQAQELKRWCDEERIELVASVFDEERFEWMEALGMQRYKIASRTVQDRALCRRILATGKETFISLGMWTEPSVPYRADNARYLYCVARYPCEYGDLRLPRFFPDSVFAGFSDHTLGIEASLVAVARGAQIIEKHFTLNRAMKGTDHAFSLEPVGLRKLVRDLTRARVAMVDGAKRVHPSEVPGITKMGKKLVAARALPVGHVLTQADVALKSPGDGLPPYELPNVLGRATLRPFEPDEAIWLDALGDRAR